MKNKVIRESLWRLTAAAMAPVRARKIRATHSTGIEDRIAALHLGAVLGVCLLDVLMRPQTQLLLLLVNLLFNAADVGVLTR